MFNDITLQSLLKKSDDIFTDLDLRNVLKNELSNDSDNESKSSEALKTLIDVLSFDKSPNENNKDSSLFDNTSSEIEKLLQNLKVPQERLNRYKIYNEIYSLEPLVRRIIKTYSNNILQKDAVSTDILITKKQKKFDDNNENVIKYKSFVEKLKKEHHLDEKLKRKITHDFLISGDHFIEVIDLKNDVVNLPDVKSANDNNQNNNYMVSDSEIINKKLSLISEDINKIKNNEIQNNDIALNITFENTLEKLSDCIIDVVQTEDENKNHIFESLDLYEMNQCFDYINNECLLNEDDDEKNSTTLDNANFNRILLRHHSPENIVIMESTYGTLLGYIEVKEDETKSLLNNRTKGIGPMFAETIGQLRSIGSVSKMSNDDIISQITNKVVQKIINDSGIINKKKISGDDKNKLNMFDVNKKYEDLLSKKIGEDLFILIKKLYIENKSNNITFKKLKVRFISTNRMISFSSNVDEFEPYGTSQVNDLIFPAKNYLLTKLLNTIVKYSRASLMRKWTLEVGPKDQHMNEIQKLSRQLRNQRTTIGDIVSVKTFPNTISDFKDVLTLSKKGQKFLDMDIQQTGDPNIKIQDLQDAREELLAISGVPSVYVGYDNPVELREQLVNTNIVFAIEIIDKQMLINKGVLKLINVISEIFGYNENIPITDYVTLQLKPPTILLLQMLDSVVSTVGNLNQIFMGSEIQIDPFYFLNQFISNIDWNEFINAGTEYTIKQKATGNDEEGGGGMGY